MEKISDKQNSPYQKAVDANPAKDGPHRKVKVTKSEGDTELPPYVVAVTKHEKDADAVNESPSYKRDPQEARAKAKALLNNPQISAEHKRVLKEILGPDKDES